ncbi:MAG: methionyl-tRNA formyltransferase [Actinomycetaceae bacterium]|nr:methionyl-tRNA formyltransferase [Actinomycetaceae bacterium]MDY6083171.1 methionyl-tRNA formyltransferase [Actinomycetaceae bacterium]
MRIFFAGTPATALPSLQALADQVDVVGVLTRAPAPVGRHHTLTPSAVQEWAEEHHIPVYTPRTLHEESVQSLLTSVKPDAVAVVAYGLMIPSELLSVPTFGWINLHFSLLPRWRGAAPVQAALASGDTVTGVTTFRIDEGLDTGAVLLQEQVDIPADADAGTLLRDLSERGADVLVRTLRMLEAGHMTPTPQEGTPTYAHKVTSKDARIDFSRPATDVVNHIRSMTPTPGAWAMYGATRVKLAHAVYGTFSGDATPDPGALVGDGRHVWIGTATDPIEILTVAPAGKKWMAASDWMRGQRHTMERFQ